MGNSKFSLREALPADLDAYERFKKKLDDYFTTMKKNKHHARYMFLKMKPTEGETTTAYTARLRGKSAHCEFGDTEKERILEHLIETLNNENLVLKTINKKWSLEQLLRSQFEVIKLQMNGMKTASVVCIQKTGRTKRDHRDQ